MTDLISRRLTALGALFLTLQAIILTLSPAVRERTIATQLRWSHWVGLLLWLGLTLAVMRFLEFQLPGRDAYIVPICCLLSGWGILEIWRLDSGYGLRQLTWFGVSIAVAVWLASRWDDLAILRRYRYILLSAGLILTALTIFMGTSPTGTGPRLWLGCCGIYLQPSEPLKLMLLIFLAAYFAEHLQIPGRAFPLLLPTILVTGLALVLLLVQRDLGSASILITLYTIMLFLATARRRVLLVAVLSLSIAALAGYFFVGVVRSRLESWLNPWADPSGLSYQIVQSLMAIANGAIVGRGLGLGNPGLVPVSHSDFMFSAIAEEGGLLGGAALLTLFGLLLSRGFVIALRASNRFHSLLAGGLTAYLGIQALLIIGGDLRLFPLTGVTLPFVSYGGSSLLTSVVAATMLLTISSRRRQSSRSNHKAIPYSIVAAVLGTGLVAAVLTQSWWAIIRGPDLLIRTDNPRRSISDRYVVRGSLLDRGGLPISVTTGAPGSLRREYAYPELGPVVGYTDPAFGQAGLEASLDGYLRGTKGNPTSLLIWDQLVYGTPPPGLDIRLTIDLVLQNRADQLLGDYRGAIVLVNASSGEILAMASHPTFDANQLDHIGTDLLHHEGTPLLNRATQGTYALGNAAQPLIEAAHAGNGGMDLKAIYELLGFYSEPAMRMPVAPASSSTLPGQIRVSPLQLALAAASLSNGGLRPAPRIALAVNTPNEPWIVLPALEETRRVLPEEQSSAMAVHLGLPREARWQWRVTSSSSGQTLTWVLAGTLPEWKGTRLIVVVLLESADVASATSMGSELLRSATSP